MGDSGIFVKRGMVRYLMLARQGIPCLFYRITGVYCPGCGGTRAVKYLMEGRLLKSLQYHPLVGYLAFAAALEAGSRAASKWKKNPGLYLGKRPGFYELVTYGGIVVAAVNWCVKNWALLVLGVELIP